MMLRISQLRSMEAWLNGGNSIETIKYKAKILISHDSSFPGIFLCWSSGWEVL